jgi:bisphosphoglycerate-dependent phosphoglycerate mutase
MEEARNAGKLMKEAGYEFDVAYVSVLKEPCEHYGWPSKKWICSGFLDQDLAAE